MWRKNTFLAFSERRVQPSPQLRETGLLWDMDGRNIIFFPKTSYDIDAHHWWLTPVETKKMENTTPDNFVKENESVRYVTWNDPFILLHK